MARILIIEDEPDEQDLLADVLALEGHEVRTAGEAAGALGLVRRMRPDLIILDLRLPGIGGLDLLKLLRTDPVGCDVPVLLCTGSVDLLVERADEIRRHATAVLEKPYDLDELLQQVGAVIAAGRAGGQRSTFEVRPEGLSQPR